MNRKVKEEEILLFLDKEQETKFDRDTFRELLERHNQENDQLTPYSFF